MFYSLGLYAQVDYLDESKEDYQSRMKWFKDAKYGMFIHFGLYSQLGGDWEGKTYKQYAEWIQANADIIVFGGLGLIFDDYHFFRSTFENEGVFSRTVMFVNQASDPMVERLLVPDMALAVAERFAVENGARVMSLSWGTEHRSQFLENAMNYASSKGLIIVASAGNSATNSPHYPAASPGLCPCWLRPVSLSRHPSRASLRLGQHAQRVLSQSHSA